MSTPEERREQHFNRLINEIKDGHMVETCGYHITKEEFYNIVKVASQNIDKWGWYRFEDYINNKWTVRLKTNLKLQEQR